MSHAAELADALEGVDSLAIVCHDNPDPDCLASALALEKIAYSRSVEDVAIVFGGEISHQQNRAFVNMLDIGVRPADAVELADYEYVAYVDHSRAEANSTDADSVEPDAVIDHHPGGGIDAPITDVRTEYGATATIFVEYLLELEVEVTVRLASALLFALHRERLDFVREPTEREYEAALAMYPMADLESLEQLYGSAFSPATIDAIGHAIAARDTRGSSLVASVGRTPETDALPQAADYLLNLEGIDTVLVYGLVGDAIRMSARSIDPRVNVGETLEEAFGELGAVGGHHDMAGGRIDLGLFADAPAEPDADDVLSFIGRRVERRFFDRLNLDTGIE